MNTNYFYLKYLYWDGYILHHDTTCFKKNDYDCDVFYFRSATNFDIDHNTIANISHQREHHGLENARDIWRSTVERCKRYPKNMDINRVTDPNYLIGQEPFSLFLSHGVV